MWHSLLTIIFLYSRPIWFMTATRAETLNKTQFRENLFTFYIWNSTDTAKPEYLKMFVYFYIHHLIHLAFYSFDETKYNVLRNTADKITLLDIFSHFTFHF